MIRFGVLFLLVASGAWGQTFCAGGSPPINDANCIPAKKAIQVPAPQVAPLKCGKYQHVYHWPGSCGPSDCDGTSCYAVCYPIPPDRCVDDLHTVTEREWQGWLKVQATQQEVNKALEKYIVATEKRFKALEKERK